MPKLPPISPHKAAHLLRRHAEYLREVEPQFGDTAPAPRIARVMPARPLVIGHRRARLHRHAGDALHPRLEPDDMRGMGKGGGGRGLVADLDIDAEIAGGFVPQLRRARFQRVGGKCDRRQRS